MQFFLVIQPEVIEAGPSSPEAGVYLPLIARMTRFCISMPVMLSLLLCPLVAQSEQDTTDRSEKSGTQQYVDWSVSANDIAMNDGSQLREFVAAVSAKSTEGLSSEKQVSFQFVFHPRFLCSPLIRVVTASSALETVSNTSSNNRLQRASEGSNVSLSIDGEPVDYPALVERQGSTLVYFYNVNLQRRATLRILVELGDDLEVRYADGSVSSFSLQGSQKALDAASANCLQY